MATVTAGYNWVSGETVTPAKLNSAAAPTVVVADNEITTAKIADDAVTNDKLSLSANAGEIKKVLNADNSPPIFACRAWVNFDGTRNEGDTGASTNGANVKIRASGNVASVLKNGTGDYTVTFTTAMPDASYAIVSSNHATGTTPIPASQFDQGIQSHPVSTTTARIYAGFRNGSTFAFNDSVNTSAAIFR